MEKDFWLSPQAEGAQTETDGAASKGKAGHRGVALSFGIGLHSRHQGWKQEGAGAAFLQVFPFAIWAEGLVGVD